MELRRNICGERICAHLEPAMVCVMVVALNEHWQRVGDMAARTVVVNTKAR